MSRWPLVVLSDVASIRRGESITRKTAVPGDIPVVAGGLNSPYTHAVSNAPAGSVTVSGSGANAGHVLLWEEPIWASDCSVIETLNVNILLPKYCFLALKSQESYIKSALRRGAAQPHVYASDLADLSIPLPPLNEQKRIVDRIDQIFAGIDSAEQVVKGEISAVQSLTAGLITELLSQTGDVRVFTLAELIQDGLVSDHMDGNHGGDYPRKSEFLESGVPYISARAIVDGQVEFSAAKYLSPKRAALLRKGLAKNDDVLFAHNATVGPVAVLRTEEPLVILGTSLTYYRCDSSRLWPDFLAHYMRSFAFVRQYQNVMGQSTRNQVPITTQRRFTFSIPSLPIQMKIAETMNAAVGESSQLLTSLESKLALFRGLRSSAMTQALRERL